MCARFFGSRVMKFKTALDAFRSMHGLVCMCVCVCVLCLCKHFIGVGRDDVCVYVCVCAMAMYSV